jgi:peptide/nickel transport system permease protein
MQIFFARRLLQVALTLFLVSLTVFFLLRILPGDVALLIVTGGTSGFEGGTVGVSDQELGEIRESLGIDGPLFMQYLEWIRNLGTLDLGNSLVNHRPVGTELLRRIPVTLELAVLTMILAMAMGIPLGIISAINRDTWVDYLVRFLALTGLSVPNFWLATLLLMVGLYYFRWIPPIGYTSLFKDPLANLSQVIWPALVLSYSAGAIISRMTRSSLLEVLRQEYIRTAKAKGLGQGLLIMRHALKNAMLPVVTVVGLIFVTLLSGAVIMEQIFMLPGLGLMLLDGIRSRDFAVIQPLVLLFSIGIVSVNLFVDLLYAWLDPRIRIR